MSEFTISMAEAAAYSGIPVRKWLTWSRNGLFPTFPRPPEASDALGAVPLWAV